MSRHKKFVVRLTRTVKQSIVISVVAEDREEARMLVCGGHVPAQWPDGNYLDSRDTDVIINIRETK